MNEYVIWALKAMAAPVLGAIALYIFHRVPKIGDWLFDHADNQGNLIRAPVWRLATVVGAMAGLSAAIAFSLLVPNPATRQFVARIVTDINESRGDGCNTGSDKVTSCAAACDDETWTIVSGECFIDDKRSSTAPPGTGYIQNIGVQGTPGAAWVCNWHPVDGIGTQAPQALARAYCAKVNIEPAAP